MEKDEVKHYKIRSPYTILRLNVVITEIFFSIFLYFEISSFGILTNLFFGENDSSFKIILGIVEIGSFLLLRDSLTGENIVEKKVGRNYNNYIIALFTLYVTLYYKDFFSIPNFFYFILMIYASLAVISKFIKGGNLTNIINVTFMFASFAIIDPNSSSQIINAIKESLGINLFNKNNEIINNLYLLDLILLYMISTLHYKGVIKKKLIDLLSICYLGIISIYVINLDLNNKLDIEIITTVFIKLIFVLNLIMMFKKDETYSIIKDINQKTNINYIKKYFTENKIILLFKILLILNVYLAILNLNNDTVIKVVQIITLIIIMAYFLYLNEKKKINNQYIILILTLLSSYGFIKCILMSQEIKLMLSSLVPIFSILFLVWKRSDDEIKMFKLEIKFLKQVKNITKGILPNTILMNGEHIIKIKNEYLILNNRDLKNGFLKIKIYKFLVDLIGFSSIIAIIVIMGFLSTIGELFQLIFLLFVIVLFILTTIIGLYKKINTRVIFTNKRVIIFTCFEYQSVKYSKITTCRVKSEVYLNGHKMFKSKNDHIINIITKIKNM